MSLSLPQILSENKSIEETDITNLIKSNKLIEKGLYEHLLEIEKIQEEETLLLIAQSSVFCLCNSKDCFF